MSEQNALDFLPQAAQDRLKSLMALADQRPSAEGFSGVTVYEIGKRGGWVNPKDKGAGERDRLLVIPLVLRETRAYWARKGTGGAPDCRSIDGVKPVKAGDDVPQAETCSACPWNKYKTAEEGAGKKCKTKGVLFAMEINTSGGFVGPVVLRFSMGNRQTPQAIMGADRAAQAMGLPRFLTYWNAKTGVAMGGGGTEFIFFAPDCTGKVPESKATEVIDLVEKIATEQADKFLSFSTKSEQE